MNPSWLRDTGELLLRWHGTGSGFGYRPGGTPFTEPTALAGLALRTLGSSHKDDRIREAGDRAAQWLATLQHADGCLGLSHELSAPHWPTSLAIRLWNTDRAQAAHRDRAAQWLAGQSGIAHVPSEGTPFGHDSRIAGWPWVDGTHAWLEPTALAVIALRSCGLDRHERVNQGLDLIRDRAIRSGGWNYGNSQVFGTDLRPHPGPTGLALVALAGREDRDSPRIRAACNYLLQALPGTRAPQSLCFGLLGLAAWNGRPMAADSWIESAFERIEQRGNQVMQVTYLLLAAMPQALPELGVVPSAARSEGR